MPVCKKYTHPLRVLPSLSTNLKQSPLPCSFTNTTDHIPSGSSGYSSSSSVLVVVCLSAARRCSVLSCPHFQARRNPGLEVPLPVLLLSHQLSSDHQQVNPAHAFSSTLVAHHHHHHHHGHEHRGEGDSGNPPLSDGNCAGRSGRNRNKSARRFFFSCCSPFPLLGNPEIPDKRRMTFL